MSFRGAFNKHIILILLLLINSLTSWAQADTKLTQRPEVISFINQMVTKHHFKKSELITLFNQVTLRPQVISSLKRPLEQNTWNTYQRLFVTEWRIKNGIQFWDKHANALRRAEELYGVPAGIIVATIGVETKYGQRIGDYRVIDSLSSIAFSDSVRAPYFRKELEEFLLLTKEQHLDIFKIMGSYAGAIGQPQFMPSSYRTYAVNFSRSGKIDLIHNDLDVIGSVANYYSKNGWTPNAPVATQALMIGNRYNYLIKRSKIIQSFTIAELTRYGIVPKNKIAEDNLKVKVIELRNHYNNEYWLGFHNFDVIKRYNSSDLYAMAVYHLSNYMTAIRERLHNGRH